MQKRFWFAGGLMAAAVGLFVINSSELAPKPSGQRTILAHRGVYQRYDRTNLNRDTCTASRMLPSTHALLENTLPSMKAGFDAGADIVEIDVHPTTDGQFAVFHDWTVDCRTEGHGVTREHTLAELQALDIGHGYTADGGKTYPFRGKFKGQMPSLKQVLDAFPDKRFLINIKSNDPTEADKLVAYLKANNLMSPRLSAYGGDRPVARLREIAPGMRAFGKKTLKSCALSYLALGWSGHMPKACRNTTVFLPGKFAWLAWGYPNRLQQRFRDAGSDIYLLGNNKNTNGVEGIDTVEALDSVPDSWRMGILTDEIETIGPAEKQK
ncbi:MULTISPECIES: glycerophosphodiester phosphodiesterase family protein [Asticcacaulis]|uniref:glycerophosphodiester phosphodiesterase family protein n=1 Tax=Asticcacaulis TaxID=76890 RepID=UPI001AE222A5|nr:MULTISPECIES: glycerophosphodiester phosphodiesterase family protein [Asticcacaulis]MBP2158505.1 glycerophosphoryl diester phosphodiesterase [Asticcacaulis solisilvae]MDR6799551.1 glycerophosphoryl diester phosphodiesterase [Asticcacaulis sp. BE141]